MLLTMWMLLLVLQVGWRRAARGGGAWFKVQSKLRNDDLISPVSPMDKLDCRPQKSLPNCNAMLQLKKDSHMVRLSKPSVEQEHFLWDMKEQGLLPYSNTFLRFSWTKAFPL